MEIQLPEDQSYFDNIRNGSITEIWLPKMEGKWGKFSPRFLIPGIIA
jgi:hypothetical protein